MMGPMLEITDLHAFYGKSHVLHGVNLAVGKGEIVSLLGRNGVGRSTTVKAAMGQVAVTGSIRFRAKRSLDSKPSRSRIGDWVMCPKTAISSRP